MSTKEVCRVIPSELVAKLAQIGVYVDREIFQTGHIGEIFEVLARKSLAEARMM